MRALEEAETVSQVRIPLLVIGVYGVLVGVVQLVPSLAEAVFGRAVIDPAVEVGWGASLLTLGLVALGAARNRIAAEAVAMPFALGLVVQAAALAYWWMEGSYSAGTAVPPVVINLTLAAWTAFAATRASAEVRPAAG